MTVRSMLLLPLALLALFLVSDSARAQDCTPIDSLPYTITQPGTYCLTGNQSTSFASGAAITIQTDNVVLDLGAYMIDNTSVFSTTAIGVSMPADHTNVTVRGGMIRGFDAGINLGAKNARAMVVEGVRLDRCYRNAIVLDGHESTVRHNFISTTGGSNAFPNSIVIAISVNGSGLRILDNDVVNTIGGDGNGATIAILVNNWINATTDIVVEGNRITNQTVRVSSSGITVSNSSTALVIGNRITAVAVGVSFTGGAQGKYRDNVTFSVTTPFLGGTNAGGNT
jgi:hypothetical protein